MTPNFVLLFLLFVVSAAAAAAAPPPRCVPSLHGQCWGTFAACLTRPRRGGRGGGGDTRVNVPSGFSARVQISQVCVCERGGGPSYWLALIACFLWKLLELRRHLHIMETDKCERKPALYP